MPISQPPQKRSLEASSLQIIFSSVNEHQPQCGFAPESHPCLFPRLASHMTCPNAHLSGPVLSVLWLCEGYSHHLNGTPNTFSTVAEPDWARKWFLSTSGERKHIASSGLQRLMSISWTPQNKHLKFSSLPGIFYSVKGPPLQCGWFQNVTTAFVPPSPPLGLGWKDHSAAQFSLYTGYVLGGFITEKALHMWSPVWKCQICHEICLLLPSGDKWHIVSLGKSYLMQSHKPHETSVWKPLPWRVNLNPLSKTIPHAVLLWKETLAFWPPRTLPDPGQNPRGCPKLSGTWLYAVVFCHFKGTPSGFSSVEEPDLEWMCLLFPSKEQHAWSQLGWSAHEAPHTHSKRQESGSLILAEIFYLGKEPQAKCMWVLETALAFSQECLP